MNNYLANIAARTFSLTTLVRPRLPGQFEPAPLKGEGAINRQRFGRPPAIAAELQESEIESEASVDIAPRRASNRRTGKSLFAERESGLSLTAPPGSQSASKVVRVEAPIESKFVYEATEPGRPSEASSSRHERKEPQSDDDAASRAALDERRSLERQDFSVGEPGTGSVQPALSRHDQELSNSRPGVARRLAPTDTLGSLPAGVREKTGLDDSARRNSDSQALLADTAVVPSSDKFGQYGSTDRLPVIVQSRIAPRIEGDRFAFHQQATVSPEPTVHVTIGRIEVRAVQSSQPSSSKPRPTQPVMNLDDYLRRRSNGGAR